MKKPLAVHMDEALRVAGRLVALAALTAVLFFVFGVALKPLFPDGLPRGPQGRQVYLMLFVLALGIAHVVVVAVADKGDWKLAGIGKEAWSPLALLGGAGLGIALQALVSFVGHLVAPSASGLAWAGVTTTVVMLTVMSTLVDALLLRGYLIGALAKLWGEAAALAITALVATLLVLRSGVPEMLALADVFMLAALLGAFRLRMRSIMAVWLAHLGAMLVFEGMAAPPVPGITAFLSAVVTLLLFRLRPATKRPGRA